MRTANLIVWILAPLFGFLFVAAEPVIVLVLGAKWRDAAPVFQLLALSALAQMLLETTIWLLVSRGQSRRLLKLLLVISPIIVASFVIGLPFGIKGVALSSSLVLLIILPWIMKFTFRGTDLTLRHLGRALIYPLSVSLSGVFVSELFLHFIGPAGTLWQLLVVALGFAVASFLSALVRPVRDEVMSFGKLFNELRLSRRAA